MSINCRKILFWSPRILGILFAIFLSLFALDVFEKGKSFSEILIALLIHLIPVYCVVILLIIAWRWELIGAILFFLYAIAFTILTNFKFQWPAYLLICGPLVLISILFFLNWIHRPQPQK